MKNTGKTIWMKVRNPTGWWWGGSQGVEGTRNPVICTFGPTMQRSESVVQVLKRTVRNSAFFFEEKQKRTEKRSPDKDCRSKCAR